MGRTYLSGAIVVSKERLRTAMQTPFLGLIHVDSRDNVRTKPQTLSQLRPSESRYDVARGVWYFKLDLHDDDMQNADFSPLLKFLETVPSTPGAAFVASREDWKNNPDWFFLVVDGRAIQRQIVDDESADEDPLFVSKAQAAELMARLAWPGASEVLDRL